jgi:hypothetical protein
MHELSSASNIIFKFFLKEKKLQQHRGIQTRDFNSEIV